MSNADSSIKQRIKSLGLQLPDVVPPVASYQAVVEHEGVAYVSGQLPWRGGALITGRAGENMSLDEAREAARLSALMVLATLNDFLGSLDRIERVLKLNVFVNSAGDFTDQAKVANGASELIEQVLGPVGLHARSAVGVAILPRGALVEVDAIVAVVAD